MDGILESFKTLDAFRESRSLGLISFTLRISFYVLFYFCLQFWLVFFHSLSVVQIAVAILLCVMLVIQHFINISTKSFVDSLENDCDVFEKAVQLSVVVHHNKEPHLLDECRSRYAKFLIHQYVEHKPRVVTRTRDRAPSRIPVKRLARLMHKSRKIRKRVRKFVFKNMPMTSWMHCFVNKCHFNPEEVKCYCKIYQRSKRKKVSSPLLRRRKKWRSRKLLFRKFEFHKNAINAGYVYGRPILRNSHFTKTCLLQSTACVQESQSQNQSQQVYPKQRCRKKSWPIPTHGY